MRNTYLLLLTLWVLLMVFSPYVGAAEIAVRGARMELVDDNYKLAANYEFELNHALEETISHGIPLYFTTELELSRPRFYFFDEKAVDVKQTVRLSYNVLTRQYYVAVLDSVQQSFTSLEDALFLLRRPNRWIVAPKGQLKSGETYQVSLRMRLNLEYLPKPIQVTSINNSDWRLASDKKTFTYKAE
jgi:hypothetical protein